MIPDHVRAQLVAHAEGEAPNEACGLILLREGRAERYEPGRNKAASPYRFELELENPELWFAEDDGYELAERYGRAAVEAERGGLVWGIYQVLGKTCPTIYVLVRNA